MELRVHLSTSEPVSAGDSVGVKCSATINKTLINVDVNIDVYLIGPNQTRNMTRVASTNLGLHQASIHFPRISAKDSGHYQCNATVRSSAVRYSLNSATKEDDFYLILSK